MATTKTEAPTDAPVLSEEQSKRLTVLENELQHLDSHFKGELKTKNKGLARHVLGHDRTEFNSHWGGEVSTHRKKVGRIEDEIEAIKADIV